MMRLASVPLQSRALAAPGTPDGHGDTRPAQVWTRPGAQLSVEIDGLGVLTTPGVAEADDSPIAA